MSLVRNGQRLPDIDAIDAAGEPVTLPGLVEGGWAVVLLYRGHW